jgi:hypothetical protein
MQLQYFLAKGEDEEEKAGTGATPEVIGITCSA